MLPLSCQERSAKSRSVTITAEEQLSDEETMIVFTVCISRTQPFAWFQKIRFCFSDNICPFSKTMRLPSQPFPVSPHHGNMTHIHIYLTGCQECW